MKLRTTLACLILSGIFVACQGSIESAEQQALAENQQEPVTKMSTPSNETLGTELATFGAGCYWCVEAVLEQLEGVQNVTSGFMGGDQGDATYREVCSGSTGHAEVVHITFDPGKITYEELLDWFWRLHDPTTLNRQGADTGTQYRSVIFFHSEEQERLARISKKQLGLSGAFKNPVVTEISAASALITAPADHQDYYNANRTTGYCQMVIAPKLRKLGLKE